MASKVNPIPDGHHSMTPYLILSNAAKGIEFYKSVFGATKLMRINAPGGKIGHAELQLGDSRIMLADEYPQMGARSPQSIGGTPSVWCFMSKMWTLWPTGRWLQGLR